jgi:hypothetical protein
MHKRNLSGQQVVYAELDNRMGLPAAHFHDRPGSGGDMSNSLSILLRKISVPVFVNVFHFVSFLMDDGQP